MKTSYQERKKGKKKERKKESARSWECTWWGEDKRRRGSMGTGRDRKRKRGGERRKERERVRDRETLAVHRGSWCAISNPSCSWLCAVAQQEVGAGQTTINKRAVKNTISHQWPTTGLCACHHGNGTTPLYWDYKTPFYTSFFLSIAPFLFYPFTFLFSSAFKLMSLFSFVHLHSLFLSDTLDALTCIAIYVKAWFILHAVSLLWCSGFLNFSGWLTVWRFTH